MRWFRFHDTYSGGYAKFKYDDVYVYAADILDAERIFEDNTGCYPYNESCDCCTCDWYITEEPPPEGDTDIWVIRP